MTKRRKPYVGFRTGSHDKVFRSAETPTEESHGQEYLAVMGPFRTVAAAEFTAKHGRGNPHIQTVGDAERIVKGPHGQS